MSSTDATSPSTASATPNSVSAELESQAAALSAEKERSAQLELKVAALTGENAQLHQSSSQWSEREWKRLKAYHGDVLDFAKEVAACAGDDETLKDAVHGYDLWANSYVNATPGVDMQKHNSIATVSALASKKIKVLTEAVTVGEQAKESLADKSRRLEVAEDKLSAALTQLKGADELNTSLNATLKEHVQVLHRYGLINTSTPTNFNLPSARELEVAKSTTPAVTSNASATMPAMPATPAAVGAHTTVMGQTPVLTTVEATASKGASSSNMHMDPLLMELERRCASGLANGARVMPSGTQHSHVGMAGLSNSASDTGLPADVLAAMSF